MNDKKEYASFSEEVWDRLSRIKMDDHMDWIAATGKRPDIAYLPWHTAWSLLKRKFPASTYNHEPEVRHPDDTVEVEVNVRIYDNVKAQCQTTNARLAVMDNFMNPISNPTARQVNDSRQRCLVKALAFAGLGLTLWSGDSIPIGEMDDPIDDDELELITDLIEKSESNLESFLKWADDIDSLEQMTKERFPKAKELLQQKIIRKNKAKVDAKKKEQK